MDNYTTVIIDGNNMAYRANVMTELYTSLGQRTSAIHGVLSMIPPAITKLDKEYLSVPVGEIIVSWDCGHSKRRTELFPDYKGNRSKERTEEDKLWMSEFIEQINELHDFLPNIGVKSIKIRGWESDDIIYSLKAKIAQRPENNHVVIISTDEDFLQLIDANTSVFSPIKEIYYTYDNFAEVFGIPPESFIGYKVLKGDTSDNISGIRGIGDKTAKKLMNEYGSLAGLLNNPKPDLLKSKTTQKIFTPEGLEILNRNNQLISLEGYVPCDEIDDEIEQTIYENPSLDKKATKDFLTSHQLSVLLMRYPEWIKVYKSALNHYYS